MNQPIETYTFSRALHLMRYGGKKMRNINWVNGVYVIIKNGDLQIMSEGTIVNEVEIVTFDIMGVWVEVK